MIFEERNQDPRARDGRVVEGIREGERAIGLAHAHV